MTEPVKLCSAYDDEHKVVCDAEKGHKPPHVATVLWGDEDGTSDE